MLMLRSVVVTVDAAALTRSPALLTLLATVLYAPASMGWAAREGVEGGDSCRWAPQCSEHQQEWD
jgi:hypothetical protein